MYRGVMHEHTSTGSVMYGGAGLLSTDFDPWDMPSLLDIRHVRMVHKRSMLLPVEAKHIAQLDIL